MPDNGISSAFPPPAAATRPLEQDADREPRARAPGANEPAAPRDSNRDATINPPEVVVELRQTGNPENDGEPARDPQLRPGSEARPDLFAPAADNTPRGPVQPLETGGAEELDAANPFTPGREALLDPGEEAQTAPPQTPQAAVPTAPPPAETVVQSAANPVTAQVSVERAVETPPAEAPNPVRENLQAPAVRADRIQAPEPAATPEPATPAPAANREPAATAPAPAAAPETPDTETAAAPATPPAPAAAQGSEPRLNSLQQLTRPSPEDLIGTNVDIRT